MEIFALLLCLQHFFSFQVKLVSASDPHEHSNIDEDAYNFLPDDWMNNTYWQDETHCTHSTDEYLTFSVTQDRYNPMSSRDGCQQWCEAQANFYEANCCVHALFGNEDVTEFQSYCALFQITEGQVPKNPSPEGIGLTSFYSSNLMTDIDLVFDFELPEFEYTAPEEDDEFELNIDIDLNPTDYSWETILKYLVSESGWQTVILLDMWSIGRFEAYNAFILIFISWLVIKGEYWSDFNKKSKQVLLITLLSFSSIFVVALTITLASQILIQYLISVDIHQDLLKKKRREKIDWEQHLKFLAVILIVERVFWYIYGFLGPYSLITVVPYEISFMRSCEEYTYRNSSWWNFMDSCVTDSCWTTDSKQYLETDGTCSCSEYFYRDENINYYDFENACYQDPCVTPNQVLQTDGTCSCADYYYRDESVDYTDFDNACTQEDCSSSSYLYLDGTCCTSYTHSVVFVLDESGSIWPADFTKIIDFVTSIITSLNSSSDNGSTKMGLVGFSNDGYTYSELNSDFTAVQTALDGITQYQGMTNSLAGLSLAYDMLVSDSADYRFIVYLSDGESNIPREVQQTDMDTIEAAGIVTIAIGVGSQVLSSTGLQEELQMIATNDDLYYYIDDYDALSDSITTLEVELCIV